VIETPFANTGKNIEQCPYQVGDEIEFFSKSKDAYVRGTVTAVHGERHIEADQEDAVYSESVWGEDNPTPFKVLKRSTFSKQ